MTSDDRTWGREAGEVHVSPSWSHYRDLHPGGIKPGMQMLWQVWSDVVLTPGARQELLRARRLLMWYEILLTRIEPRSAGWAKLYRDVYGEEPNPKHPLVLQIDKIPSAWPSGDGSDGDWLEGSLEGYGPMMDVIGKEREGMPPVEPGRYRLVKLEDGPTGEEVDSEPRPEPVEDHPADDTPA